MSSKLLEAFYRFMDSATSNLRGLEELSREGTTLKSVGEVALPRFVDELEKQKEFHELVVETQSVFAGDYHVESSEQTWHNHVHNFFCQSGYYLDLMYEKDVNLDTAFSNYCASFEKRETEIIYLAPLEFVSFAQPSMDFAEFQIRRFSMQELDRMLRNHLNDIFYPYAAISPKSLGLLANYWFIYSVATSSVEEIGHLYIPPSPITTLLFGGYAERWYTEYPKSVELPLRSLCLFDWSGLEKRLIGTKGGLSRGEDWKTLHLFNVPFVLEVNGDLLSASKPSPDFSKLVTQPFVDAQTREELGEIPEDWISLDSKETERFKVFVQDIERILGNLKIKEYGWEFIDIALGYFTKAFFATPGLEQMLWYIAALEALLSEEGEGVTGKLANRISLILGKDRNHRKGISKRFRELYDVQSSLVHGKSQSKADVTALIDAYRFSRLAILWFLRYLSSTQARIAESEARRGVPRQSELLLPIDINSNSRYRLQWLMNGLPEEFPHVSEWIE